jgi:hypothetical protein
MPFIGNAGQFANIYEKNYTTSTLHVVEGDALYQAYNPADSHYRLITSLQEITETGSTTSVKTEFTNTVTSFTTTSNAGVANTAPEHTLDVGTKFWVDMNDETTVWVDGATHSTSFDGETMTLDDSITVRDVLSDKLFPKTNGFIEMTSNVGILNTAPEHSLSVGANVQIDEYGSNTFWTSGNVYSEHYKGSNVTVTGSVDTDQLIINDINSKDTDFVNFTSNVGFLNTSPIHTLDIGSNVQIDEYGSNTFWTSGNVYSEHYKGSNVTVTGSVDTDQLIINDINSKDTDFVNFTSNVGFLNTSPIHTLDIGSNVQIDEYGSNTFWTSGNVHATKYSGTEINLSGTIVAADFILSGGAEANPAPQLQTISEVNPQIGQTAFSSDRTLTLSNVTTALDATVIRSLTVNSNLVGDNVIAVTVNSNLIGDNVTAVTVNSNLIGDNVFASFISGNGDSIFRKYSFGVNGISAYTISGPGFTTVTDNPSLTLIRGQVYVFDNTTYYGSHPLKIRTSQGGTDYTTGIVDDGAGKLTFTVPMDAPIKLYYQCANHSSMGNTIYIPLENLDTSETLNLSNDLVVDTDKLVVDVSEGNVGINKSNPLKALDVFGEIECSSHLTVGGDLIVNGTTTSVNTSTLSIEDTLIELGKGNSVDTNDLGLIMTRQSGNVAVFYNEGDDKLQIGYTPNGANDTDVTLGTSNRLQVDIQGNLQVGTSNLFVDTATSNVGIGTDTPMSTLDVRGDYAMGGHIVPSSDSSYDIGSPEFKIRDLFASNNSIWVGDRTKIVFENDKLKFKNRKIDKVPKVVRDLAIANVQNITNEADVETAAVAYAQQEFPNDGIATLADLKLQHWKSYTKSIDDTKELSDIFADDVEDYVTQSTADTWNEVGSNIYSTHRMTIGSNTEPRTTLDINTTDALIVPSGTTDERPSTSVDGMLRHNTTTGYFEYYTFGAWASIGIPSFISMVSPTTFGGEIGNTFTIYGSFFDVNTTVSFKGMDNTTYPSGTVSFINSYEIRATNATTLPISNEPYRVVVTNGTGLTAESSAVIYTGSVPTFTTPNGQIGSGYMSEPLDTQIVATDPDTSIASYSVVVGNLPQNVTLNSTTGAITTETLPDVQNITTYNFTIEARDTGNNASTGDFSIQISPSLLTNSYKTQLATWGFTPGSLAYKATIDGLSNSAFHTNSDGLSSSIVIITTENGYIFGGIATNSWSGSAWKSSTTAFVFNLYGNASAPIKWDITNTSYNIYTSPSYGPTFGDGHDIYTNLDTNTMYENDNSYGSGGGYTGRVTGYTNQGNNRIVDVEVWSII